MKGNALEGAKLRVHQVEMIGAIASEKSGSSSKRETWNCLVTQQFRSDRICPREMKTCVHTETCKQTFMAALYTVIKRWKPPDAYLING